MNPEYPVYIISKGRSEYRLTQMVLEKMQVPYHIVIEPQEFKLYRNYIPEEKILILPFSNLGQGSIPARNWVWEHSILTGAAKHWILDDNIYHFERRNKDRRHWCESGTTFRLCEIFTDRYTNVALSGMNYTMFASDGNKLPPFNINTRIYSCILIRNDIPYRWRGRYNEDTDLSIRALKGGWCTILFNAFLAKKKETLSMPGGNMEELYQGDGRLEMAKSLKQQHPDIAKITRKFKRWQHQVDYSRFNQKLIRKEGVNPPARTNEYGMKLVYDEDRRKRLFTKGCQEGEE